MSFPKFRHLPLELQLRIWEFSLPAPRVVDLFAVLLAESLTPRSNLASSPPPPPPGRTAATPAPIWTRTLVGRVYTSPQCLSCVHVCAAARSAVLRRFVRISADARWFGSGGEEVGFRGMKRGGRGPRTHGGQGVEMVFCRGVLEGGRRPFALLDPGRDVVFLRDPVGMVDGSGGLVTPSLEIVVRSLGRRVVERLERLALPYDTWRKTRRGGRLGLLMEFKGLRELSVTYLGDGEKYRETWSDVLGGPWSHMKEVEEEVMGDVEGLKRRFAGWRVPTVRVVKHRGVLVTEVAS